MSFPENNARAVAYLKPADRLVISEAIHPISSTVHRNENTWFHNNFQSLYQSLQLLGLSKSVEFISN